MIIQEQFLHAFNQLIDQRDFIAKDIKVIVDSLTDTEALKSEVAELRWEMEVVTELMKQAIAQNASMAREQEEYATRYNALAERCQNAADRYRPSRLNTPAVPHIVKCLPRLRSS